MLAEPQPQYVKLITNYKIYLNKSCQLGQGSFSKVYLCSKIETGEQFAIKIIEKLKTSEFQLTCSAILTEVKIMKAVDSTHIVRLIDVMESSNNYYIIQELCEGDLRTYLGNNRMNEYESTLFLRQIAQGFLALIKQGIVHRDLKPENIFIKKRQLKIGDFGISHQDKFSQHNARKHTHTGSAFYRSPQMFKGQYATSKCDIWSIGVIFYEMLHHHRPWGTKLGEFCGEYEFYKNIQKNPLEIDKNLSQNAIHFLKRTLCPEEQDRIGWDQLFCHPIFQDYFIKKFLNISNSLISMENKYKMMMSNIRFYVNSGNIDLKKLWKKKGFKDTTQINLEQFIEVMRLFVKPSSKQSKKSQQESIKFFFESLKYYNNGKIKISDLNKQFQQNSIALQSKSLQNARTLLKRIFTIKQSSNPESNQTNKKLQENVMKCFKQMQQILDKNKLLLQDIFNAFANKKNKTLNLEQFSNLMITLDNKFKDNEIKTIFQLIDENNNNQIEFSQLNSYYSKLTGTPELFNRPVSLTFPL